MKLRLNKYDGNHWFLLGENLANDSGFVAHWPCSLEIPDSERWDFEYTVTDLAKKSGIPLVFNQIRHEGFSAFECWTDDEGKVLALAEAVAAELRLELHID